MAVISITITESPIQKVAGIPVTVTLTTNVPATIFYTLDGTDPTTSSSVAVGPIELPTDDNTVNLKVFATDGVDTSAIVSYIFGTSTAGQRQPHDKVYGLDQSAADTHFPFGSQHPYPGVNGIYGNTGGTTVDNKLQPRDPLGYDGTGTGTPGTYYTPPLTQYSWVFSETDAIGQRGRGIGTLPAGFVEIGNRNNNDEQTEYSSANSPFFNARALVIFQDSRQPQYDDMPTLMRPYFSLERPGVARDGALLQTAPEGIAPSGSLLRSQYNPKNNTITYYYYDNRVGRWIISTEPFVPKDPDIGNLSRMVFSSRLSGAARVFKWIPFQYRRLI
jgi:hypothetical protein